MNDRKLIAAAAGRAVRLSVAGGEAAGQDEEIRHLAVWGDSSQPSEP